MARGIGYGFLAGIGCGVITGGSLMLVELSDPLPPGPGRLLAETVAFAAFGGGYGAVIGLAVGMIGGVAFALAAPCLARRPRATRLAGAALAPCLFTIIWISWRAQSGNPLAPVSSGAREIALVFFIGSWLGAVAGWLVAPAVLHGPGRAHAAADRRTRRRTDGMGADSSG